MRAEPTVGNDGRTLLSRVCRSGLKRGIASAMRDMYEGGLNKERIPPPPKGQHTGPSMVTQKHNRRNCGDRPDSVLFDAYL